MNDNTDWLAQRRAHVCSTDAAAICGLSPWKTALEVALEKTGRAPERPPSEAMKWGLRLQPAIASGYSEQTGLELVEPPRFLKHPALPWMGSSFDYFTTGRDRVVECKLVFVDHGEWGEDGSDRIPDHVALQIMHQMEVAQIRQVHVAALMAMGPQLRIYHLDRNQRLIDLLLERE